MALLPPETAPQPKSQPDFRADVLAYVAPCFSNLPDAKVALLAQYAGLLTDWNARINLVSRKDIAQVVPHHVLHGSLVALWADFRPGDAVLDVGSGGGVPGIPLAILYPEVQFHLVDSIKKKTDALTDMVQQLALPNVTVHRGRVEELGLTVQHAVGRAVTRLPDLWKWVHRSIACEPGRKPANGLWYLTGGDIKALTNDLPKGVKHRTYPLSRQVKAPHYETKALVYCSRCFTV